MAREFLRIGSTYLQVEDDCLFVFDEPYTPPVATLEINAVGAPTSLALVRGAVETILFTATNGQAPYVYTLVSPYDALPAGMSLVSAGITGTPTTVGDTVIQIRATDGFGVTGVSGLITITVGQVANLEITTATTLPRGAVGAVYSKILATRGGWGAVTWTKTSGTYPPGVSLASSRIEGSPTTEGTYVFTLEAEDSEARTSQRTFSMAIVAAGALVGPHEYLTYLTGLPSFVRSWTLRDQSQINSLCAAGANTFFTYDPGGDTRPDKQDACKYVKIDDDLDGKASIPLDQQLKFPVVTAGALDPLAAAGSTVVITWDYYFGQEFPDNYGGVTNLKTFQIRAGNQGWWTLMESPQPAKNSGDPTRATHHTDEIRAAGRPEGMERFERVLPSGAGTPVQYPGYGAAQPHYHSVWTRYWVEIRLTQDPAAFTDWNSAYAVTVTANPDADSGGKWHMVSLWSADETHSARRILWRVPMNWSNYSPWIGQLSFEFNTSKLGFIGPWVGYARNVAVLHGANLDEGDTDFFKRPERG